MRGPQDKRKERKREKTGKGAVWSYAVFFTIKGRAYFVLAGNLVE